MRRSGKRSNRRGGDEGKERRSEEDERRDKERRTMLKFLILSVASPGICNIRIG